MKTGDSWGGESSKVPGVSKQSSLEKPHSGMKRNFTHLLELDSASEVVLAVVFPRTQRREGSPVQPTWISDL